MPAQQWRQDGQRGSALIAAVVVLGMGFAAFFDGIVFHQVLQWHHMASSIPGYPATTVAGLEANIFFDGLFHLAAYLLMAMGGLLLWRARQEGRTPLRWRRFVGALLLGGGGFNVSEGLVNHFLLGLHHVRDGPDQMVYDVALLAISAIIAGAGVYLLRAAGRATGAKELRTEAARAA